MSLVNRPARDVKPKRIFRDDTKVIIACDDTYAPKQYFNFLKLLRVEVVVVPTTDGTSHASHVLSRLLETDCNEEDERWLLLDTDHCINGTHFNKFNDALCEARRNGIKIALSRPCFELWLLLHFVKEDSVGALRNANEVEAALRKSAGEYNKTKLNKAHYPPESIEKAYLRASDLHTQVGGGDGVPNANTTRVHLLLRSVLSKSLASNLPEALRKVIK